DQRAEPHPQADRLLTAEGVFEETTVFLFSCRPRHQLCQLNPTILFIEFSAEGKKEIARKDQLIVEMRGWLEQFRHSICKDFGLFSEDSFAYDFDKHIPNPLLLCGFLHLFGAFSKP